MYPIYLSYQQSDLLGKVIFLLLFTASLVTWTLFLKKFLVIREIKKEGHLIRAAFSKKFYNPMQFEKKQGRSSFSTLFMSMQQSALRCFQRNNSDNGGKNEERERSFLAEGDIRQIEDEVMLIAADEIKKVENHLFILSTLVALAPFLGLLGTVWGILTTFIELQANSNIRAESSMMGGLAMALATTVVGLIVAIPALVGYNYLRAQINQLRHDMLLFSQTLVTHLRHFYCKENP